MKRSLRVWASILGSVAMIAPAVEAADPAGSTDASPSQPRLRLVIETDAGGDPDDEQSLVRFLLYANEWDLEGIIANRAQARDGENRNIARTGPGIVHRLIDAYAECWPRLVLHDPRYPRAEDLRRIVVPGDDATQDAEKLLIAAVDSPDPRPLWYSDWGTDHGAATNNLRRVLDRVLQERGQDGYAAFKSRLRLASADAFGPHTSKIHPPFPLWVDTFRPEMNGRRWYHQFSRLTARAGGFDLVRDCLVGHGPLGALYPTNTTHWQKEGDSLTFIYLIPTGMHAPENPHAGGWGGRLGHNPEHPGKPYFWANQLDAWNGSTNRDNTLARWAADLQNDFKARLDWCVKPFAEANHAPRIVWNVPPSALVEAGAALRFAPKSLEDPDDDTVQSEWIHYPEAGTYENPVEWEARREVLSLTVPPVTRPESLHWILRATDDGEPALHRYARLVLTALPKEHLAAPSDPRWDKLRPFFSPAAPQDGDVAGPHRPLLQFEDGRPVVSAADWAERRRELRAYWERQLGAWPAVMTNAQLEVLRSETREDFTQERVRVPTAPGQSGEGWLLIPRGEGPFPAVLVVYYEPETGVGLNPGQPNRDFALQLTRRGFVTLSIGTPGGDARKPDLAGATCQPLSFHAYVAANCWQALAHHPRVDPARIGVTGHSYGGKWAMFAAALSDRFAAVAVSDPGIVFDEARSNVNYWEPWYLGQDPDHTRTPGVLTAENGRTGAYARLIVEGRNLHEIHALIAPRPFLVSGGSEDPVSRWADLRPLIEVNTLLEKPHRVLMSNRDGHAPTPESNEVLATFFEVFLNAPRP